MVGGWCVRVFVCVCVCVCVCVGVGVGGWLGHSRGALQCL